MTIIDITSPVSLDGHRRTIYLLHAGIFFMIFCRLLIFSELTGLDKFFQEYHQGVKQFGSRCRA